MNYTKPPIHLITDKAQVDIVEWNVWRSRNLGVRVYLDGADLSNRGLGGIDLSNVCAVDANFSGAYLHEANLNNSNFDDTKFDDANLVSAKMRLSYFAEASFLNADLSWSNAASSDFNSANFDGATLVGTLGINRFDISAAVPVGSGQLCSAYFDIQKQAITIWGGCNTFSSFAACHARIVELGGEHQKARMAWLKWVSVSLTGKKLKFWLDTANTNG